MTDNTTIIDNLNDALRAALRAGDYREEVRIARQEGIRIGAGFNIDPDTEAAVCRWADKTSNRGLAMVILFAVLDGR